MNPEFSRQIFETRLNTKVMRIGLVGAESLDEDRRTDMTKGIVTPRNLQKAPADVSS
jgi:hypothetical protein